MSRMRNSFIRYLLLWERDFQDREDVHDVSYQTSNNKYSMRINEDFLDDLEQDDIASASVSV